jgi:hypothetical protein
MSNDEEFDEKNVLMEWEKIERTSFGYLAEDKYAEMKPTELRSIIAKRALISSYEEADTDPVTCIYDCMADMLLLGHKLGIDPDYLVSKMWLHYKGDLADSQDAE